MTAPLAQRLRTGICDQPCKAKEARSGCECAEAADEIERLTAAHAALVEALTKVLELAEDRMVYRIIDCARAALAQEKK